MRIQQLAIKNFKGFAEKIFDFPEQFSVLIGCNGAGKTAVLDALAIALQEFLFRKGFEVRVPNIPDEYVRYKKHIHEGGWSTGTWGGVTIEQQFPVSIG